jgi:serine/threonine protein kinase/tetratricopeptide (TPR) repeat protein
VTRDVIGSYRLVSKLGEGGMGVVYSAHDERLGRPVALKMIRGAGADDRVARERFWREARAAAAVSHPNVCQLFEVGEVDGELFLAMELLEGESLETRIARGPVLPAEALQIALAMLGALEALHRRGLVHRDLKPSNIFLTPHGIKLLDFGLARSIEIDPALTGSGLTIPGTIVGTPKYMAPEALLGEAVDARADLFAAGAILFEMLTGKPPFQGRTLIELGHAIVHERPAVLTGTPLVTAIDRVIHRALEKKPERRYQDASAMAHDLRAAIGAADSGLVTPPRAIARLAVLPFRALRSDPDVEFLAFGLPDAITVSLSTLESLVVRSSLAAAKFAGPILDLKAIATELDVDTVLAGTLLRSGDQLRVSAQLLEAPAGTVLWSHTSQVALGDLFGLQDDLAGRIVASLKLPLTAQERQQLSRDVPATARAYEFYLRANQLANDATSWTLARDLYEQCVEEDPAYAPAWARLGRMYRVIAKFVDVDPAENEAKAEAAVRRALSLNPNLSLAHKVYAHIELDSGRAIEAMVRLLERARTRAADPELFVALVQACRYCGLLDASEAAYHRARRLDPILRTSFHHTLWARGEYQRARNLDDPSDAIVGLALASLGQVDEASRALRDEEARFGDSLLGDFSRTARYAIEGDRERAVASARRLIESKFKDPEGRVYRGMLLALAGDYTAALETLDRAVRGGYYCHRLLEQHHWLDPIRTDPQFVRLLKFAAERRRDAVAKFIEAGGEATLGVREA